MTASRTDVLTRRLYRPLTGVIAAVGTFGVLAALVVEPAPAPATQASPSAGAAAAADDGVSTTGPVDTTAAPQDAAPEVPGSGIVGEQEAAPVTLGPSIVPVPGTYRYRVESTRDGETTVQDEERQVTRLSGDDARGLVEITARLEGERQVSIVDWSPEGALVRTTRIESAAASSRDCTWQPPFAELGVLAEGSTWSLASTCRAEVAGADTTFEITGTGRVLGSTVFTTPAGAMVPVWLVERDRTTAITAVIGPDRVEQRVHERGVVLFDPARGVVVRSDVTVTLDGAQQGVTQRVSVLQDG